LGLGVNTLLTRNFYVVPAGGSVQVNVTTWTQGSRPTRAWTTLASSGSINVTYRVGDLVSGDQYTVRRGSSRLATLRADSKGYLSFTSSADATSAVTYSLSRK